MTIWLFNFCQEQDSVTFDWREYSLIKSQVNDES